MSASNRFTKIGADGAQVADDATDHVAVLDNTTGLMWSHTLNTDDDDGEPHAACEQRVEGLSLAGFTDWRMPTVEELFAIADRTHTDPAIDAAFFPDTKSDWYWTGTPAAWSPSAAWIVYFNLGLASSDYRDGDGFVRAVRVAGARAGQSLEIGHDVRRARETSTAGTRGVTT